MEEDEEDADTHTHTSKPHTRLSWLLLRRLLSTKSENEESPIHHLKGDALLFAQCCYMTGENLPVLAEIYMWNLLDKFPHDSSTLHLVILCSAVGPKY